MSTIYDETGAGFQLSQRLASGGQGVIYRIKGTDDHLFKQYHSTPTPREISKHRLLQSKAPALSKFAALPLSLGYLDKPKSVYSGVFLSFVKGAEIFELYQPKPRQKTFPKATFKFLVQTAYNLCAVFEELHSSGIVVGDINERNIKVLPDATIRLIDCDSFQITDGATTYTSDVGTPIWTPSELQGKHLTGLVRTQNHDLFGLAQLIFLLLFNGRYPFAGVSIRPPHLEMEEAIRTHAYAFAPPIANSPLSPPPACPSIETLPKYIEDAFLRAFMDESPKPNFRPSARSWRGYLENLSKELVSCSKTASHVFWKGAVRCPWCDVFDKTGFEYFPSPFRAAPTPFSFSPALILERLRSLRPVPLEVSQPAQGKLLLASPLPPVPIDFWNRLYKFLRPIVWRKQWIEKLLVSVSINLAKYQGEIGKLQNGQKVLIEKYRFAWVVASHKISRLTQNFSNSTLLRHKFLDEVIARATASARDVYLQGFEIRSAKIYQVGPARKATLSSFSILTAADITRKALSQCHLPSVAVNSLIGWSSNLEGNFRPDPDRYPTQAHRDEAETLSQAELRSMLVEVANLETQIALLNKDLLREFGELDEAIQKHANSLSQVNVDKAMLEALLRA